MSTPNGYVNGSGRGHEKTVDQYQQPVQSLPEATVTLIAQLEAPFDSAVIEWRVTNTTKDKKRGQVIPYANQRAYTDRLNALVSPAGWTRKYIVHTSPNFERNKDQKTTAKVFVTCELTIFGIGSHSATGEEWADDDNAGTSAEAQAFKRACSCFGLGRYLYHFTGTWVDLDDRKRPTTTPKLAAWATPEGWRQGLRPKREGDSQASTPIGASIRNDCRSSHDGEGSSNKNLELSREIEAMAAPLGRALYRGLMKATARAWKPQQVHDSAVLEKVLAHMQAAERGLLRLQSALDKTGVEALAEILNSLKLKSLDQVDNLETLHRIVLALEAKAGLTGGQG